MQPIRFALGLALGACAIVAAAWLLDRDRIATVGFALELGTILLNGSLFGLSVTQIRPRPWVAIALYAASVAVTAIASDHRGVASAAFFTVFIIGWRRIRPNFTMAPIP